jgi:hypothetical protein
MSSLAREQGHEVDMEEFMDTVCGVFGTVYERLVIEADLDAVTARAGEVGRPAAQALAEVRR